jgi:hypothetical protein
MPCATLLQYSTPANRDYSQPVKTFADDYYWILRRTLHQECHNKTVLSDYEDFNVASQQYCDKGQKLCDDLFEDSKTDEFSCIATFYVGAVRKSSSIITAALDRALPVANGMSNCNLTLQSCFRPARLNLA